MQKTFPRFLIDNFIDNRIKVLLSHAIVGHFHQFYFYFSTIKPIRIALFSNIRINRIFTISDLENKILSE